MKNASELNSKQGILRVTEKAKNVTTFENSKKLMNDAELLQKINNLNADVLAEKLSTSNLWKKESLKNYSRNQLRKMQTNICKRVIKSYTAKDEKLCAEYSKELFNFYKQHLAEINIQFTAKRNQDTQDLIKTAFTIAQKFN